MNHHKIVIATGNPGKANEIAEILRCAGYQPLLLSDILPNHPEPEENGQTYLQNACIKAHAALSALSLPCLGDDVGLEIDHLNGQPGLYSRRFLGENVPFSEKMDWILREMHDVHPPHRTARFQCGVCIAIPGRPHITATGTCEGTIGHQKKGTNGFGYDPIFALPDGRHMAELTSEEKNRISHRGVAMQHVLSQLRSCL
jgi:XTP/dITP diphosphohydrolase